MNHFKGAFQATLALLLLALVATPVQARITIDALGGELEVEGFLKSETRTRVLAGTTHLGQWIQRLQIEAALSYVDVGPFDELTFVAIARPEYDIVQDMGDLSANRIGDGTTKPSLQGRQAFTAESDLLAFNGFDNLLGIGAASPLSSPTGGIFNIVSEGFQPMSWLQKNFEVDFARSPITRQRVRFNQPGEPFAGFVPGGGGFVNAPGGGFPLVVQKSSNLNLTCNRCVDLNIDNIDVATANTDSNGRLYPFRELYVDGVIGDFWIRVGKQQIVWGKTDFFRLQDLINPVDFGQHLFFDSFEDIRIPQWMASVQYKAGSIGPLTDNAFQVIWNFDEFQQVGLGNPSGFWAHPFAKDVSTFAIFNTFFSIEPCVSGATAIANGMPAADICGSGGPQDRRQPSGFGTPAGLSINNRPEHKLKNTEAGWRWEFRFSDFRVALSHWYGWNDLGAFKFHTVNLAAGFLTAPGTGLRMANDVTVGDLVGFRAAATAAGFGAGPGQLLAAAQAGAVGVFDAFPVVSTDPLTAAQMLETHAAGTPAGTAAARALATGNFAPLYTGTDPAYFAAGVCTGTAVNLGCLPYLGGQTSQEYERSHTLGLAVDYFEPWSGIVFRIESSWTFDELVTNTRKFNWLDNSDVMRFSIGLDRPTFIPFLNKDRTFFLSMQIFDTWYWDHDGDKNTGYFTDEHNFITTFFFLANYMRDTIKPIGAYVWEEAANSHVLIFNVEWLIDNHWSIRGGLNMIWEGDENMTHDTGPFTSFITPGVDGFTRGFGGGSSYPYVTSVLGPAREGLGSLRNYDEVFFELKYQF